MAKRTTPTTRTSFGLRLVQAREHAQLSQPEAAKRIGKSQSTIAEAETIGNGCTWLASAARAYGVDPYWLETGEGKMLGAGSPASAAWPFHDIAPDQWAGLSERHKGRLEQSVLDAIAKIHGESGKPAHRSA
jgi:transcriptional regulator with XRE-family HTH domain